MTLTFALLLTLSAISGAVDPLPSLNHTAPKKVVTAFVEKVTKVGSADFVPVAERIATFENHGTPGHVTNPGLATIRLSAVK